MKTQNPLFSVCAVRVQAGGLVQSHDGGQVRREIQVRHRKLRDLLLRPLAGGSRSSAQNQCKYKMFLLTNYSQVPTCIHMSYDLVFAILVLTIMISIQTTK